MIYQVSDKHPNGHIPGMTTPHRALSHSSFVRLGNYHPSHIINHHSIITSDHDGATQKFNCMRVTPPENERFQSQRENNGGVLNACCGVSYQVLQY